MKLIFEAAFRVRIGSPSTFRNLTVFPLLESIAAPAGYLTLDEALAQKCATITEVSEGGSVPELKFINSADQPVFLLDGEENWWGRSRTGSSTSASWLRQGKPSWFRFPAWRRDAGVIAAECFPRPRGLIMPRGEPEKWHR